MGENFRENSPSQFISQENPDNKKLITDSTIDAYNECIREMNRNPRSIKDKGPPTDPCILEDPNIIVCVNKKMGLMNGDGSYNLEHFLSLSANADTAEKRQRAMDIFNVKIKECSTTAGSDPCKMVLCVQGQNIRFAEDVCGRVPNEDDGC